MNKIGWLSDRECAQILTALVVYRNLFHGLKMPVTDELIKKFDSINSKNNERKGNSDL